MMRQRGRLCYVGMSHCQPREVSFIGVDRCLARIGLSSNAQWLQQQGFTIYPLEGYRAVRLRAAELATAKAQRAAPLRGARPAPEGIGALPVAPRAAQVATHGFAPQSQLATYLVEAATQLTIAVQSDHAKLGPTYRTLDTARILTNSATHTALRFTGPVNNPGCHSPALTWPRRDTRVVVGACRWRRTESGVSGVLGRVSMRCPTGRLAPPARLARVIHRPVEARRVSEGHCATYPRLRVGLPCSTPSCTMRTLMHNPA